MKWLMLLALLLETSLAYAHNHFVVPDNPKWQEECGSCHVAYPPQLLTAADWRRLMGSLDKHFGDNAAVDPKLNQEITAFLEHNAGSGAKHSAESLRITDTSWFKRAHHEVSSRAWSHPAVKSPANCTACHVNATRGDWTERGVRMPAGLGGEEEEENED